MRIRRGLEPAVRPPPKEMSVCSHVKKAKWIEGDWNKQGEGRK
jgi:hypothetical protein